MGDSSSSESDSSSFSSYSSDSSSSASSTTSTDLSSDSSGSSTSSTSTSSTSSASTSSTSSTSTSSTTSADLSSDSSASSTSSDSTSTSLTTSNDSSFFSIVSSLQGVHLHRRGCFGDIEWWNTADEVLSLAKPGDLIEFERYGGIYCHWAVYVGNGYVINYGRPHPSPNLVQKEHLTTVSAGDRCRINNLNEEARKRRLKPFKSKKIVERAAAQLGKELPYNVFTNNCEVFATKCRYGKEGFTCQPLKKVKDAIRFPLSGYDLRDFLIFYQH